MVLHSKFWRRTPPALFPCILGFLGLGIAWRKAAEIWPIPTWVGEGILVIAATLFLFTFVSYMTKLSLRPSVVLDDLKVLPARGTVTAGAMCMMVLAAAIFPYHLELSRGVWWFSIILQTLYVICVIYSLSYSENNLSNVTPSLMLPAVGYIVAAIAGPDLGYVGLSKVFLIATSPFYALIVILSLLNVKPKAMPPPVRASYAILLAPTSIYGIAALGLWGVDVFATIWWMALVFSILMLLTVRWLATGGWNPGWGAFTFPLSALASVLLLGVEMGFGMTATIASLSVLSVASLVVPYVVWKTFRFWAIGKLAEATGAAVV
jgi:tellurite resistance protein